MLLDHVFPPDIRVENEIESLSNAGHEVHIACFMRKGEPSVETTENCVIHRKEIPSLVYKASVGALKCPVYFNFWRKFTRELFINDHYDVVHVHDLPLARVGYELKQQYGVKFVLDLHENWPVLLQLSQHANTLLGKVLSSHRQWIAYEKDACKRADKIIVVVEEAKFRIAALGVPEKDVTVVSNTLNMSQFDVINRDMRKKEDFRLLYVGGINYHRGIQYVIEAISLLKQRGAEVVFDLVGNGRYLENIKKQIAEKHLENNVIVHGFRRFTDIPDVYESASLAIIPHVKSGHTDNTIPHKLFQYMYAEIPILSSNCNPLERIINETHCGICYQYDDVQQLAEIIKELCENPDNLQYYVGEGRKAVVEKYNWVIDGQLLVDMYSDL